jgi:undecaprenyl-diphosphatase
MEARPIRRTSAPSPLRVALRAVAAFGLTLGAVLILGWVLQPHFQHNGPTDFDASVTNWFVDQRSDPWTTLMKAITWLGSTAVVIPLTLAVAAWLLWRRRWWLAAFLAASVAGASLLSAIAKYVIDRDRPPESLRLQHPVGSAFPSGHSTQAAATYLALAFVVFALTDRRAVRLVTSIAAALVVFAVGISRVYLGVHWATDVIAGWLLGVTWVVSLGLAFGPALEQDRH